MFYDLLTETEENSMFCGPSTVDVSSASPREHQQSRVHKTYCFPLSQSIYVKYLTRHPARATRAD